MLRRMQCSIAQACNWRKKVIILSALTGFCMAGCAIGPDYHSPEMKMPNGYASSTANKPDALQDPHKFPVVDATQWWQALNDPELNSLIDRAIQNNLDIEIALDRLQEARTEEVVVMGGSLPTVDASVGIGTGTGSDLARGRVSAPLVAAENTGKLKKVTRIAGFDAGWELDLFGKYRRAIEAAGYSAEAAIAARNSVLISVIADVARAYIDLRALQMQLALLQKNIGIAEDYVHFTKARFEHGITNEMDLDLAQRQLSELKAEKMPLISQIDAAKYVIGTLIGKFPEDLVLELDKPGMIPSLPEKIDTGIPLDLLRRRPDIIEAEREIATATANKGVAIANLFPSLSITAGAGYQGGVGASGAAPGFIWSAGPALSWSLLDFGTLDGLVDLADLQMRERLVNYKRTVLNAVREVDTSIGAYTSQQDRLTNLDEALLVSQQVLGLATQRYQRGLTDSLNVIDAEREQYILENEYVISQQAAAEQFVVLYKALGGGWERYQSFPPIHQPQPAVIAAFKRLLSSGDASQ